MMRVREQCMDDILVGVLAYTRSGFFCPPRATHQAPYDSLIFAEVARILRIILKKVMRERLYDW